MNSPHEEEYRAEVRSYLLWCEGKLEELRRAGSLSGEPAITEQGMAAYRKLVESDFRPTKEKVLSTLRSLRRFEESDLEEVAVLLMADGSRE